MHIEEYFTEMKGITVDAARKARSKYTPIDMCRFAKNYNEQESSELLEQRNDLLEALKKLYNAIDSCVDLTPEILQNAKKAISKTESKT